MDIYEAARLLKVDVISLTKKTLQAAHRIAAKATHPDTGGCTKQMQQLNDANCILKDYLNEKVDYNQLTKKQYAQALKDAGLDKYTEQHCIALHITFKKENPFSGVLGLTPMDIAFGKLESHWLASKGNAGQLFRDYYNQFKNSASYGVREATETLIADLQLKLRENIVLHSFMTYSPFVTDETFSGSHEFLDEFLNDLDGDPYDYESMIDGNLKKEAAETIESLKEHISSIKQQAEHALLRIGMFYLNHPNSRERLFLKDAAKKAGIAEDLLYKYACIHSKEPVYKNTTDRVQQLLQTDFYRGMSVRIAADALGVSPALVQRCKL